MGRHVDDGGSCNGSAAARTSGVNGDGSIGSKNYHACVSMRLVRPERWCVRE
uniref:Uncharacterized protein n=1 Tax=Oryza glumipatula TaxID=40148 RepID=A0A0E0AIJ8_9ORYZ